MPGTAAPACVPLKGRHEQTYLVQPTQGANLVGLAKALKKTKKLGNQMQLNRDDMYTFAGFKPGFKPRAASMAATKANLSLTIMRDNSATFNQVAPRQNSRQTVIDLTHETYPLINKWRTQFKKEIKMCGAMSQRPQGKADCSAHKTHLTWSGGRLLRINEPTSKHTTY